MKNKLKYLRYRNLHTELARYGYEYTPRKALYSYVLLVLSALVVGGLYKLEVQGAVAIILFGVLCLPSMILQAMEGQYHTRMFSLANNYMEHFLYSFERTGTVLSALKEVENVFDNEEFKNVLEGAIKHILYSTESTDVEKEALDMIGGFFNCDKVDTLHKFVLGAQRRGGDSSNSITLLEKNRSMWVKRICNLQKELRTVKRNIMFAVVTTVCVCLLPLYLLGENLDISTMPLCQISAVALIGMCIIIYQKADKKLCRSWLAKSADNTKIEEKYIEIENYNEEEELKTSMKMAVLPIVITTILFVWKQKFSILLVGSVLVMFLLNQHKIGHHLGKKKVEREIEKQFPEWLMQLALLLQTDNVQIAIRNSVDDAPNVLRPALRKLILELEEEPGSILPYNRFLKAYHNADVQSAMQMLYALSIGNLTNIEMQINELIERNNAMMDKAEQLSQEDLIAGMKVYILLPSLTASFKLMVDMSLLLILFLQNLQF